MLVKTQELERAALNWAVAKCEGKLDQWGICSPVGFRPSTDWSQGGPIIEREGIELHLRADPVEGWSAFADFQVYGVGPTPLIAAMRCFVASRLGDSVDIPDKLIAAKGG